MMVRSCTMHLRPMFTGPRLESSRARGCTTLSDEMVMGNMPATRAESAMVMLEEKLTGALGPADGPAEGIIEWRLLDIVLGLGEMSRGRYLLSWGEEDMLEPGQRRSLVSWLPAQGRFANHEVRGVKLYRMSRCDVCQLPVAHR